ncbi:hypothetical protein EDC04DRAFT_2727979 [Pisolithus marmoratus]|nr:hypothetical protein EDC04DRAFT_2727979 [Pisolithus marmoratus]
MGKGYKKSSSHPSFVPKRLSTACLMPRAGQPLSPCPDATIAQHNNSSSPEHSNKRHHAKCKEILQDLSGEQEYIQYEGVSFHDYIHIMDRSETIGDGMACKRLIFFPESQLLMVVPPTPANESVLNAIMESLSFVLFTIPVPRDTLACRTHANTAFRGRSVCFIPDLIIFMHSDNVSQRPLWMMECAFTQTDRDDMRKLRAYVRDNSELLVVGKIVLKQATPYCSPGSSGSTARELRSSELMTRAEWDRYCDNNEFTAVIVDSHTWFSLSSVEIHLWMRQPGNSELDIDRQEGDGYAFGTLHPTVNLTDIDKAFRHGLDLIKDAVVLELQKLADVEQATIRSMEDWTPPPCLLNPKVLAKALIYGARATAYQRYYDWHAKLKRTPYSATRHRTSRRT